MARRDTLTGHASELEVEELAVLRRRASEGLLTTEELLRLALQLFEPVHDPFAAVDVLKELLRRDPPFDLARIWLAYLDVYELMDDDALREAVALAEEVSSTDDRLRAAALLIKGAAVRHLAIMGPAVSAVEESIRIAGDWVTNRQALGDLYRDMGRRAEAVDQFRAALENLERARQTERRLEHDRERELFEIYLTGLAASEITADIIRDQWRAVSAP
jgi:tetratricopeptide (TPR) repeat protein